MNLPSQKAGTREQFHRWLRKTHSPAHARRTAERNAAFLLPHLRPGMRLIDVGCGPGSITTGLAAAVAPGETLGVDISDVALDDARARAADKGADNLSFQPGDAYGLPFEDASFDAAFMHAVMQHLSDPLRALREVRRVLRPGAVIGLADADLAGGGLVWPPTPALEFWLRLREREGGSIDVGRRLRVLLHEAGFSRTTASVTADADGTAEATQRAGEWQASYLEAPEFAVHVIELGLTTSDELREMAAAWRAWGEHPGAFFARTWCQAVGWVD